MHTITQTITALPAAPDPVTDTPSTFSTKAAAFVLAQTGMVGEQNALAAQINTVAADIAAAASQVGSDALNAANSASAAAQASNVTVWVSGTSYTAGQCRWSPANFQTYRRKTDGAGTIDPSLDATNWAALQLRTVWMRQTANFTAVAFYGYHCNTSGGSFTMALPASPSQGDSIKFKDSGGSFGANNLTIDGNGKKVNGYDRLILDSNYISGELVYDTTDGWGL